MNPKDDPDLFPLTNSNGKTNLKWELSFLIISTGILRRNNDKRRHTRLTVGNAWHVLLNYLLFDAVISSILQV
ncbi:hypothetical protein Mapa_015205 [Marchantia paleacea]|nr:hypothetical protein Mapa_015205 [Marchantia paleacea]